MELKPTGKKVFGTNTGGLVGRIYVGVRVGYDVGVGEGFAEVGFAVIGHDGFAVIGHDGLRVLGAFVGQIGVLIGVPVGQ